MSCFALRFSPFLRDDWDDAREDFDARCVPDAEYARRLALRSDIFFVDRSRVLRNVQIFCQSLGVACGMWLCTVKVAAVVRPDFIDPASFTPADPSVSVIVEPMDRKDLLAPAVVTRPPAIVRKSMRRGEQARRLDSGKGGGGSARGRIARAGILAMSFEHVFGHGASDGDWLGKGGYARDLDAILSGARQGLKTGGSGSVGRRDFTKIGFGSGEGASGYGTPGGDDRWDHLMDPSGQRETVSLAPRQNAGLHASSAAPRGGSRIACGGRNKSEIDLVVRQNIQGLRYAYSRRLRVKPALRGKIVVRFAIDEFGRVILCEITDSTMGDAALEKEMTDSIRRWVFARIDKPGDVTEVVYPFVFSN